MVSKKCSIEYWDVVEKCLIKFHGIEHEAAWSKVTDLKERFTDNDLIYHIEPFDLACDLGNELNIAEFWNEYEKILNE